MILRPGFAKYLIRIDDICPTMSWKVWTQVEELLLRYEIQPILAVVPDNRDPALCIDVAQDGFWEHVRRWQARGWTIGLHGYQHQRFTPAPETGGRNRLGEFAGWPVEQQEMKLRRALGIFARENVTPEVWIAPAHCFDAGTLAILSRLGLRAASDGFFLWPHTDRHGMFWIPQQLWRFRRRPLGVWTVCLHTNAWGPAEIAQFEENLKIYRDAIASFAAIRNLYSLRPKGLVDRVFPELYRRAAMLKGAPDPLAKGRPIGSLKDA